MFNVTSVVSNAINDFIDKNPIINKTPVGSLIGDAVGMMIDLKAGNLEGALKNLGELFQGASALAGNIAKQQPLPKGIDFAKLFGTNALEKDIDGGDKKAKAASAAGEGTVKSLGALLAFVGQALVKAMENTMTQLRDQAKQLDKMTKEGDGKGPTAELNQKIQELTFNLQQIQQSLNRVNETVTNLSKSQSDAQGAVSKNLAV